MSEPFVLEGDELVRVVGVSHYQDALRAITGRTGDEQVRVEKVAVLAPEPDNPHDPDAVAVKIDGQLVGYLSRDENKRWGDVARSEHAIGAEAFISGREGVGVMGVFLRLPTPTEARAQIGIRFGR